MQEYYDTKKHFCTKLFIFVQNRHIMIDTKVFDCTMMTKFQEKKV